MITKETATDIAMAHREIETAKELLIEIQRVIDNCEQPDDLRDRWGIKRYGLELGVPSSGNSKRLFSLDWELAKPVIKAHINKKECELVSLNEQAKGESK